MRWESSLVNETPFIISESALQISVWILVESEENLPNVQEFAIRSTQNFVQVIFYLNYFHDSKELSRRCLKQLHISNYK